MRVISWAHFWFCESAHACLCVSTAICRSSTQDTLCVSAQVRFTPPVTGDLTGPHQVWFHQPQHVEGRRGDNRKRKGERLKTKKSQHKFICIVFHHKEKSQWASQTRNKNSSWRENSTEKTNGKNGKILREITEKGIPFIQYHQIFWQLFFPFTIMNMTIVDLVLLL